jgi:hypothetical protein
MLCYLHLQRDAEYLRVQDFLYYSKFEKLEKKKRGRMGKFPNSPLSDVRQLLARWTR